jgi:hypothetical protein
MTFATDAIATVAAATGLSPVVVAAELLPDLPSQASAGRAVFLVATGCIAIVAFSTAIATWHHDHTPQGAVKGPAIAFNYHGNIFTVQPYETDEGVTWWTRIGPKLKVEGGYASRGNAILRARRVIDYRAPLR